MTRYIEASDTPFILDEPDVLKALVSMVEVQSSPDGFYFVDEGNLFVGGEPSAEFMVVIDKLRARGVEVVILTSDNPNNLSTYDLADQMTSELGIGNESDDTLNIRVIVCTFNLHAQDEPQYKEVECYTGDGYEGVISANDTRHAQDLMVAGYKAGNPDAGFMQAFQYFEDTFEQRDAMATQQAMPRPEATATPYTAPTEDRSIDGATVQPSYYETHRETVNAVGITSIILTALVGTTVLTRPKRMFVKNVEQSRRSALSRFTTLNGEVSTGTSSFRAIESFFRDSYPEKAVEFREEYRLFNERWSSLQDAKKVLVAAKVGFFRSKSGMNETNQAADLVRREAIALQDVIKEKNIQAEELQERTKAAQTNTEIARTKLGKTSDWYEEKRMVFPNALPSTRQAFVQVEAMFKEAEQNSYYVTELALRGSDQAVEVTQILGKFTLAVDALIHSYDFSVDTFRAITAELSDWSELAIDPTQLVSSGQKLLDEAKAGIAIPDKLEDVVAVSEEAENQLRFAKDFSSAQATVLLLQDENNEGIREINKKIKEDTESELYESHIQNTRDEAANALSKANYAASQGEWSEAQSQLGILRVRTNETLAEMKRLDQLRKSNVDDLASIAKEVRETRVIYHSKTTEAWTDLSTKFKSDNYDETTKNWNILRKDMSPEETANFSSHFILIDQILKEVTDDPNNPQDIATIATDKNSMEKQEFDEAEALIRDMEKRLARAQQLMEGLLERQKLARKAEAEYSAAIKNSEARLVAALETIDTPQEDQWVDQEAEDMMTEAGELIEFAKNAGENLIFIAAFEAATKATNMAIQARKSAEDQIDVIQDLYASLNENKARSLDSVNSVISAVDKEKDEVITNATTQALKTLQSAVLNAGNDEKGLAAFEDHDLARAIETLLVVYSSIDRLRESLNSSFEGDKRTYQALLDNLDTAIRSAKSSISDAEDKCDDLDAGYAGDSSLSSAKSSLPSSATWGDSRSSIESDIQSAKRAKSYADTAERQAKAAISAAELARAAEAARAAKEAQDRADAIVASQRRETTSFTTSSNRGGATRF
ncbi:hypothetical protein KKD03_05485 [Patescibacteria group bacterium]|nr:hypothetical protein [Patescibacteria group bacterium]